MRRTGQQIGDGHYGRKRQKFEGFDIKLVLVRDRTEAAKQDEVPSSIMVRELGNLSSQTIPPASLLKAFLRSQNRLGTGTFGQTCKLKINHFLVNLPNVRVQFEALDIIMRKTFIGRCYPFPESMEVGRGLEIRINFCQSFQLTQKELLLKIDVSPTGPIKPIFVFDYIEELLDMIILNKPLCDADHSKIEKALEVVIVEVIKGRDTCKKHRVFGLTKRATRELHVPDNDSKFMHYFQEKYGHTIEYTYLPCLDVGNEKKPIYLPMEVCVIIEGQQLSRKQMSALSAISHLHPLQHEQILLEVVNGYNEEPYAKEFGIKIEPQLHPLNARVLPPPWLQFHDSGKIRDFLPEIGMWNMVRKRMLDGGRVSNWTCLNFSWDVTDKIINSFCHELAIMCQTSGMDFSVDPVLPVLSAAPDHIELALKSCLQDVMSILNQRAEDLTC